MVNEDIKDQKIPNMSKGFIVLYIMRVQMSENGIFTKANGVFL